MSPISLFVKGLPVAQPRVKFAMIGGFARAYTPAHVKPWKKAICAELYPHVPQIAHEVAMKVRVCYFFERPKSHYDKKLRLRPSAPAHKVSKPDIENLNKAILDAITDSGFWKDDSYVVEMRSFKRWAEPNVFPGALIMIEQFNEQTV